jgi:RNA polymerase sigma factor (sigma-70 family)
VEVSALKHPAVTGLKGPSPLLRLQSDERLIALTRRGQHAAFETLFSRYHSRLLSFCRHMLNSKEDAEDVLQEVFTAAFNAVLADERAINVRPWLYRIARNRSLNHLRRHSAVGVDSMDIHYAEGGISTGEKVLRRESFRQLIADVQDLPETQRTALLLREIDALSYEQIASAMETTVPSVKSLLVRARISLAEAAEARKLSCEEVRLELGEAAEGLVKVSAPVRRHVRGCDRCRDFRKHLKANNHALAAIFPVGPLLVLKKLALTKLGSTASAAGGHMGGAGAAGAGAAGAGAAAGAAGGASLGGGLVTAGVGALATKAAATLAAAALVTAGAVEADHTGHHHHHATRASTHVAVIHHSPALLAVAHISSQPASTTATGGTPAGHLRHHPKRQPKVAAKAPTTPAQTPPEVADTQTTSTAATPPPPPATQVTQVTTETTQLPATTTAAVQPTTPPAAVTTPTAASPAPAPPPAETTPPAPTPPPVEAPTTGTTTGTPQPVTSGAVSSGADDSSTADAGN